MPNYETRVTVPLRLLNTLRTAAGAATCHCDRFGPLCWRCKAIREAKHIAEDSDRGYCTDPDHKVNS